MHAYTIYIHTHIQMYVLYICIYIIYWYVIWIGFVGICKLIFHILQIFYIL